MDEHIYETILFVVAIIAIVVVMFAIPICGRVVKRGGDFVVIKKARKKRRT